MKRRDTMAELRITTMQGADTVLKDTAIEAFRTSVRGALLCPGDDGYEGARNIYNGMIDRRPALIVRCAGVADVITSVNFARDYNLLVSVRGVGHNVAGTAVCDGGLMIDLSRMQSVRVDPVHHTARAEGGVTWGTFDHETQAFDLATTGGIAGPTLGGGHGFLMRSYGLACDNLLAVDLVTADGRLLTASASEYADLFWGVRGGGGNFGIAMSFEYQLHPISPMLAGLLLYPMAKAIDLFRLYRDLTSTAPDALGSIIALAGLPDGTPAAGIVVAYNGPIEDGERLLRPLRAFGPPLADQVGPMPYTALQSIAEHFDPPGLRNYWKSDYLKDLSDDAITMLVERFATVPAPLTHVGFEHLGGAVSRVGPDETAVNYREAYYNVIIVGMWDDPAVDEPNIRWVRELWEALQPFSSGGVYVNYLGEEGTDRVRAAYGPAKYARLVALKNRYDPTNFFRLNQNIKPTA